MAKDTNYLAEAQSDAWSTMEEFVDEMVEQWRASGEVSNDLNNDYPNGDSYHHESHVDKDYRLSDAAELLDQLSEYEETDNGLWEGLEPRRAIAAQAAYTYGNAVYGEWSTLVEKLNEHLDEMRDAFTGREEGLEDSTDASNVAGEWLIRLYVLLGEWERDETEPEIRALTQAAWNGVLEGDRTAVLVLADRVQEAGKDGRAKMIRDAVSAEVEPDAVQE